LRWLGELLGLRVDARHDHRDIHQHIVILSEAGKAILLGKRPGLRLYLRVRFVRIRVMVELRHVLIGGHEALNLLLGEPALLHLLRDARAEIKQRERERERESPSSAENHTPRKPRRVDTEFRMSDVAWSPSRCIACNSKILATA